MSEALQAAATTAAAAPAAPPAPAINEAAALAMMGMSVGPTPAAASKEGEKPESKADGKADASEPVDPLDPSLFTEEKLKTPEDFQKATKRLLSELSKVNDLKRKAHRAHGAAEVRERKVLDRETKVQGRETRAEAIERLQNQAIEDFESGDTTRFLTAVGKLSKTGDPVGFWKNAAIALAKGEAFKPAEKAAIAADPELKARLERLEHGVAETRAAEDSARLEQLKTQNYEVAKASAGKHPHLAAFCAEHPERAREGIAAVMLEESINRAKARGLDPRDWRNLQPVDIATACGIIETELSARYELSPRADGQTNGEKGTTGSGPDAGRETSKEPPKPETAIAPATVPAALASHPGSANRAETPEELRQRQIRELDAMGFFG